MSLFSIIIPVYNTGKYLDKCLDSIVHQSFQDFEVILVDDGSTDNSAVICKDFCNRDKRFTYIHKQNGGVSSARNCGLDIARGEWVSFVDADDWVEGNYLQEFIDAQPKADITFFGETSHENGKEISTKIPDSTFCQERADVEQVIYGLRCGKFGDILGWTWDKFFRHSIIDKYDIRFNEQVSFREDELFTLEYCRHIESIRVIGKSLYNYRIVVGGLTNRGIQVSDLWPLSKHLQEDLQYFTHRGLCEHILKSATDYRAKNIYAKPFSQTLELLDDYQQLTLQYPQPNIECRTNHLSQYLNIGKWAALLYCIIRKL